MKGDVRFDFVPWRIVAIPHMLAGWDGELSEELKALGGAKYET